MIRNRILKLFQDHLGPSAKQVLYAPGDSIGAAGEPITNVLFPSSGLISVVVDLAEGTQVEAGMVGREGAVGGIAAFGGKAHVNNSICVVGGTGWLIAVRDVNQIAGRQPRVLEALLNFEQYLLVQARQIAACNAKHDIAKRLARWLLQASHASRARDLEATQEAIADMLGVQRASISVCANKFKEEGLIEYRRGRIIILDTAGLKQQACECMGALERQHDYLLGAALECGGVNRPAA